MKKFTRIILVALCLWLLLGAAGAVQPETSCFVRDNAGILSEQQRQSLETKAADISREYGTGVYIVTVADFREEGASTVRSCASDWFHKVSDGEGIILFMSMEARDYWIINGGDIARYACTVHAMDKIENSFLREFRKDDWFGGFNDYLNTCRRVLKAGAAGKPMEKFKYTVPLIIGSVSGVLIALFSCSMMQTDMKTTYKQAGAACYVKPDGVNILGRSDQYTHTTTVRRKISSSDSGSRSSGGGSSRSSVSRGGKF